MSDLISLVREPSTTFAVVGASADESKYGNRIYRNLKGKGYKVFAINPKADPVDGDTAYTKVSQLPETPTVAVMVVPAPVGLRMLDDIKSAGTTNVWVQPGAGSDELTQALAKEGFDWLAGSCVMVTTSKRDG